MAVAYDAATESASFDNVSGADPFTFSHTPTGTPRGVLIYCIGRQMAADGFTAVTYGGVNVPAVSGGEAATTGTGVQNARCKTFFLGSSIPTGMQTVSLDHDTGVTGTGYVVCITVTAAADTEIVGTPVLIQSLSIDPTEQNVDSGGTTALRFAGGESGANSTATITPGANTTELHNIDFGNEMGVVGRETTPGSGSRPVGYEGSGVEVTDFVHLAVAEVSGGGANTKRSFAVVIG